MTPEEERTLAAVTAKLSGEVYPGMRFRFGSVVYIVRSHERDAHGHWWLANAHGDEKLAPAVFTEREILDRRIP